MREGGVMILIVRRGEGMLGERYGKGGVLDLN
jgi:hypothetical protein